MKMEEEAPPPSSARFTDYTHKSFWPFLLACSLCLPHAQFHPADSLWAPPHTKKEKAKKPKNLTGNLPKLSSWADLDVSPNCITNQLGPHFTPPSLSSSPLRRKCCSPFRKLNAITKGVVHAKCRHGCRQAVFSHLPALDLINTGDQHCSLLVHSL